VTRISERNPLSALLAAFVCLGGLALTGAVALVVPLARARDSVTLQGFTALNSDRITGFADKVAHLVDPTGYAVLGLAMVAVALLRRRPRVALAVLPTMAAASVTTELLKPLLAQPRYSDWFGSSGHIGAASWPSGHATAAMTVALCAVLVAPPVLRPLAALLGTGLAVGVSYSLLVLGWHFPSDVLGGFLVAGLWVSLTVSGLWWADRRWPQRSGRRAVARVASGAVAPAVVLTLALGAGAGALLVRGHLAEVYATGHATFIAGALAIASLAAALACGLAFALRR
jgi:membrane-associated phospholipid phosphatase